MAAKRKSPQSANNPYFREEQRKVADFLKRLDRSKATEHLQFESQRLAQVRARKDGILRAAAGLKKATADVAEQMAAARREAMLNAAGLRRLTELKRNGARLERQAAELDALIQKLIGKETQLVGRMKKMWKASAGSIGILDAAGTKKMLELGDEEAYLIEEARHMLSEKTAAMLSDRAITGGISATISRKLRELNAQMRDLGRRKAALVSRQHSLSADAAQLDALFEAIEKEKARLEKKYAKLLFGKKPKAV